MNAAMPASVWDPIWNDPAVAVRLARSRYFELLTRNPALQARLAEPLLMRGGSTIKTLDASIAMPLPGIDTLVRASSVGLIERKQTFGGGRPSIVLRLLGACAGVDSLGRFFLSAGLAVDGWLRAEATIAVRLSGAGGSSSLGAFAFSGVVECARVLEIEMFGRDERLGSVFDEISELEIILGSRL
jgi:hypothetical protein